jgi:hypothetical protein
MTPCSLVEICRFIEECTGIELEDAEDGAICSLESSVNYQALLSPIPEDINVEMLIHSKL